MKPIWRRSGEELRAFLPIFAAFACVIVSVLLLLVCLYVPNALSALCALPQVRGRLSGVPPARLLLEGCQLWYLALMLACTLVVLLCAGIAVWSLRRVVRWGVVSVEALKTALSVLVLLGIVVFACGTLLVTERVPTLFLQTVEDLRQLEEGRTETVTVWLSPRTRPALLPGPYADGQPRLITRCGAIGPDTGGVWEEFDFPDALGFVPDPDRLFDENKSISWNDQHAQWYRLTYTTNFRLVVSAEPVSGPGGCPA